MKRIIDGVKYDTETAELIWEWENGVPHYDYEWLWESLYRKKNGEFFVLSGGSAINTNICPHSEIDTKLWLERCSNVETYERIFGEVSE